MPRSRYIEKQMMIMLCNTSLISKMGDVPGLTAVNLFPSIPSWYLFWLNSIADPKMVAVESKARRLFLAALI